MFIKYQEEKQKWADLLWFRSPTGRRRKTRYRPLRFIDSVSIEMVRFDTQKMENPE